MAVVRRKRAGVAAAVAVAVAAMLLPIAVAEDGQPTTEEKMAGVQKMCAESAQARAARQSETPLYERLGGYDRILELTTEVVRLHGVNPQIRRTVEGVDLPRLARLVADFISAGTGGDATYSGRTLPESHRHLHLTDADFIAAGGDITKGMQSMGYGEEEINDLLCIFVSLKDQVVIE